MLNALAGLAEGRIVLAGVAKRLEVPPRQQSFRPPFCQLIHYTRLHPQSGVSGCKWSAGKRKNPGKSGVFYN